MKTVIHWFRSDLRLTDNTALDEAARRAERVVPLFVVEKDLDVGREGGAARAAFRWESLRVLQKQLRKLGYALVLRQGSPVDVLPRLAKESGAAAIFCNKRYEPHALAVDEKVFSVLNAQGVGFEVFKDAVVWEEQEILTTADKPFTVFTPYSKAWKSRRTPSPRGSLPAAQAAAPALRSEPLERLAPGSRMQPTLPPAGEPAALTALQRFMAGPVDHYARDRDYPALDGTSGLSPHFRAGTLGIRTVLAALAEARTRAGSDETRGHEIFLNELIWREFYHQVLVNFPHVLRGAFRPEYDRLAWSEDRGAFAAWCEGRTGYPIVDAAMRCLNATGQMHNRLRMVVAMFLTKDLLIHWQWGERYFMEQLVDADPAANNGGWQWSAGTGTDAAPYFRIFNPVTQGERYDPHGRFVRRWIPELEGFSDRGIQRPWTDPEALARTGYAERIVRHEEQRPQCLAMFQAVKRHSAAERI